MNFLDRKVCALNRWHCDAPEDCWPLHEYLKEHGGDLMAKNEELWDMEESTGSTPSRLIFADGGGNVFTCPESKAYVVQELAKLKLKEMKDG